MTRMHQRLVAQPHMVGGGYPRPRPDTERPTVPMSVAVAAPFRSMGLQNIIGPECMETLRLLCFWCGNVDVPVHFWDGRPHKARPLALQRSKLPRVGQSLPLSP